MRYLFTSRSLTYAQRGARLLERAGIAANILRSPAELTAKGCGYSLSIGERHGSRASELLKNAGLLSKIYIEDGGSYREVRL